MTKRIFAILAMAILLTFAGCENKAETLDPQTTAQSVTTKLETSGTAGSETKTERAGEKKGDTAEKTTPAETTETKTIETKPSVTEPKVQETKPTETTPPQAVISEPLKTEETKTTETEVPPKQAEEKAKETESPAEMQPTETIEPESAPFNIDYWIAYAKSYAENKGLVLSDTAVDCWDNPIRAGTHCIYLERDIQSRLNRYAKDEDITDVWIWAESADNDRYDIYIGYA